MQDLTIAETDIQDLMPCLFPVLRNKDGAFEAEGLKASAQVEIDIDQTSWQQLFERNVPYESILEAAWAMTLRCYCGSDEVCFGIVKGQEKKVRRVIVDSDSTAAEMIQLQSELASVEVKTVPEENLYNTGIHFVEDDEIAFEHENMMTLVVSSSSLSHSRNGIPGILLKYSNTILCSETAQNIMGTLAKIISEFLEKPSVRLKELDMLSNRDRGQISAWNSQCPKPSTLFTHEIISEMAASRPDAPAISSWDGELTYAELDDMTSRLAHHLVSLGVGPEVFVIVSFPKTLWMVVSMLAIMKAGGAFAPLDSTAPISRQDAIIQSLGSTIAIVDTSLASALEGRVSTVITNIASLLQSLPSIGKKACDTITPANAAYVIFTSGSTGTPKGIIIHHGAATVSTQALIKSFEMTSKDRVIQFAAWTFDLCVGDILPTLMVGALLCIPSDHERLSDLSGAMSRFKITWACFTPTVASLLSPSNVPDLKVLVVGGEAVTHEILSTWTEHVHLINAYGPAECVIFQTCTGRVKPLASPSNVGRGINSIFWIVDSQNEDRLAPIGSIGEVVIEGPVVGRGYLDDPEKTAAAFIEQPLWSQSVGVDVPYGNRAYKSGDLARYNSDGTLDIVGRRDTQVKLHGLRIDVAGIEHQIKSNLMPGAQVVVDIIDRKSSKIIGAFIRLPDQMQATGPNDDTLVPMSEPLRLTIRSLVGCLDKLLPSYMIPRVYIVPKRMPTNVSSKLDRKRLLLMASRLEDEVFTQYTPQEQRSQMVEPLTNIGINLRALWAETLSMSASLIGARDNFLELGGDSLSAMRLVSSARLQGLSFSVTDIFRCRTLDELADVAVAVPVTSSPGLADIEPFSLIKNEAEASKIRAEAEFVCQAPIVDIYPCTAIQEGLMVITVKDTGAYVAQYVFDLPSSICISRFKNAWSLVVQKTPILRTRIIQASSGILYQAVTNDKISWESASTTEQYLEKDSILSMGLGTSLARYAVVEDDEVQNRKFVWTVHHALYDGWCFDKLLDLVSLAYEKGVVPEAVQFNAFIKYIQELDQTKSDQYWRERLHGANQPTFPAPSNSAHEPTTEYTNLFVSVARKASSTTTMATVLKAAWAVIVARYSDSDDVVFGVTSIGRNARIEDIDRIIGPTITTIPVRVSVSKTQNISSFLEEVQAQSIDSIDFEQMPIRKIKTLSIDAELACNFANLLVVQSDEMVTSKNSLEMKLVDTVEKMVHPYALVVECSMKDGGISLLTQHDSKLISTAQVERILKQFQHVIEQLNGPSIDLTVGNLEIISPEDKAQLSAWNEILPPSANVCAHKLIQDQMLLRPNAIAVSAWDVTFTYNELDYISTNIAKHLVSLGVGPEKFVALCFEKSAWAVAAMMGVMKSGGAFVPLDPSHPMSRRHEIISQTGAKVILSSSKHATSEWGSINVVTVNSSWSRRADTDASVDLDVKVLPSNIMYAIFTSGSTGAPKGIVIEHAAFVSGALGQGKSTFMDSESRIFQFSSYCFDVSILEIVTGLIFGACICIASADATEDITKAMNDMRVTWTCLTPSVVRLVQPEDVPTLKTLVLGGEAVSKSDVATWSQKVNMVLGYGPSECSVAATITSPLKPTSDPDNFGKPMASLYWIVDADDPNTLAPLGTVGEIMIEGPILARSYLNNLEKTAAAFIDAPAWLKDAAKTRPSEYPVKAPLRLYRTGDLGRLNPDGSINFVSRKDRQVKVRGQRVELSEVEHHLSTTSQIRHSVVEFPKSGPFKKKLVVVMSLHEIPIPTGGNGELRIISGQLKALANTHAAKVCDTIAAILPPYMIPTIRIVVEDMPYTPSGKINRVRVRTWLNTLDDETYKKLLGHDEEPMIEQPATDLEQSLRRIWSQALHLDVSQISLTKPFFLLGGDSILAMHVMALAREEGLNITVQDILRYPCISLLAQRVELAAVAQLRATQESLKLESDADFEFWGISTSQIRTPKPKESKIQYRFSIGPKVTASLLEDCHKTLRTQPVEVILAALIHSFASIFPERWAPTIFSHNDGREVWKCEATLGNVIDTLYQVKAFRRSLSGDNGSRYGDIQAELFLDYTGLQGRTRGSLDLPPSTMNRTSLMSLVIQVNSGSLMFAFSHSRTMLYSDRMLPWMRLFKRSLVDLNSKLLTMHPTIAAIDFPLASLDSTKLEKLVEVIMPLIGKEPQDLEDIFPCSPLQQGILVSQTQDTRSGLYEDKTIWEVQSQVVNSTVDTIRLVHAWQAVVARHGMLRAVIAEGVARDGVFGQIILANPHVRTSIVQFLSYDEWRSSPKIPIDTLGLQPPHRLTICTTLDRRTFCELECSHAITDGESGSIILQDFGLAYDKLLPLGSGPRYSDFISYTQKQGTTSEIYWKSHLSGVIPTYFPVLVDTIGEAKELLFSEIKTSLSTRSLIEFCATNGTTLPTLFQLIWAMVLQTYTGSNDVCFGFVNSGRDTPIDGIQNAVGPFLSILTSRVSFSKHTSATQILEKLQKDFASSLPHQHFGIAEIQRCLGMSGEPLFNTGMSFRKSATLKSESSILFKPLEEVGRTEYDISLVVDMTDGCMTVGLNHWTSRLSQEHAINVINTFDSLLSQVVKDPSQSIHDLDYLSAQDQVKISEWNSQEPKNVHDCTNISFEGQVLIQPNAPAVESWDAQYSPANISQFTSVGRCWIVDQDDHNKLVPIGVIGELIVQGPTLARGYLGDPETTAADFIESPTWLRDEKLTRLYKTSSLVRYSSSGDIIFTGRKDTQVKIRGHHIELGEIEHQLSMSDYTSQSVLVCPSKGPFKGQLIAVITLVDHTSTTTDNSIKLISGRGKETASQRIMAISESLSDNMPSYMVPIAWAVLQNLPLLASGKHDRSKLKSWLETLDSATHRQILEFEQQDPDSPLSVLEEKLQSVWAATLKIPAEEIGTRKSFLSLGGDSIVAMQIIARCRLERISLTVQDLLRFKTISRLAAFIGSAPSPELDTDAISDESSSMEIPPFSLLQGNEEGGSDLAISMDDVAALCHISKDQIEDVYPCTPAQHRFMAATARQPKAYVSRNVFPLPKSLELTCFQRVWERLGEVHQIFRTRILPANRSRSFQVVVKEQISWHKGGSLDQYLEKDGQTSMSYGEPLIRCAIVDQGADAQFFVLTAHHAIYEGWTMKVLFNQVDHIYHGGSVPRPVPYQIFIKYLADLDREKAMTYWRSQLDGVLPRGFPLLPYPTYLPRPNEVLRQFVPLVRASHSSVLVSTLLRAAWGLVLGKSLNSDDVIYLATSTGRSAPVPGIENIMAPIVTRVPVRVRIDPSRSVPDYLQDIQEQAIEMTPFEHTGLQDVWLDEFESSNHVLTIQPLLDESDKSSILDLSVGAKHQNDFDLFALVMECYLTTDGILFEAAYDGAIFSTSEMQEVLHRFEIATSLLNEEQVSMSLSEVRRQME